MIRVWKRIERRIKMIENILIYKWGSVNDRTVIRNLETLGYHCVEFAEDFADDHADAAFAQKLLQCMQGEEIQMVFSWNYFPVVASLCEACKIPYVVWIYECPHPALLSKTTLYGHNFFFCFDRIQAERLAKQGCKNVYHYPLAVDQALFDAVIYADGNQETRYTGDISFEGRLYTEKDKWLETGGVSEYVKGYLNGIVEAQLRVYGYNFVRDMIAGDVAEEILEKENLKLGEMYFQDPAQQAADFVNEEITRRETESVLHVIAKKHAVNLYSDSEYQGKDSIKVCGKVDEQSQMPLVFHNSRINLNITEKAIESGIPLRVLNILACGGFCLTNYQPEIAEWFEDGAELVMYTSLEDLQYKADYYLQHEEERKEIAKAGCQKVKELFDLEEKLSKMLEIVEEETGDA